MSSNPESTAPERSMKSKRSHSRSVSPKERDVSNGDLPSPSKKIKWAESASPSPERAVRGLQHDIENATQITPELEDAQQTNVGAPARATTPIEHTTPRSEAHRARLLMENKKGAEELVAQYQMQEALVQSFRQSSQNMVPQPGAESSFPGGVRLSRVSLPEAYYIYLKEKRRLDSLTNSNVSPNSDNDSGSPSTSGSAFNLGTLSPGSRLSIRKPPFLTSPYLTMAGHEQRARQGSYCGMSYARAGSSLSEYYAEMKLPCEVCAKLDGHSTFHTPIGLLNENTDQLLEHINALENFNSCLYAADDIHIEDYQGILNNYFRLEHKVNKLSEPILQLSVHNWELFIDHVKGDIEHDWDAGADQGSEGKPLFGMLGEGGYEYSEGWPKYDVVALRQTLEEKQWNQLIDWVDAKKEVLLNCRRRLGALDLPDRAVDIIHKRDVAKRDPKPTEMATGQSSRNNSTDTPFNTPGSGSERNSPEPGAAGLRNGHSITGNCTQSSTISMGNLPVRSFGPTRIGTTSIVSADEWLMGRGGEAINYDESDHSDDSDCMKVEHIEYASGH